MQYRNFGKTGLKVSVLGFGTMRLPTTSGKPDEHVDEKEAIRMVRHGIDSGINYVDTAKPYHGGRSEKVVGKALKNGYREKVTLATKLPTWEIDSPKTADRIFDEQRADLGTEKIDVYMLHTLQRSFHPTVQKHKLIDWLAKKKEKGQVGHIGFSFHDDFAYFKELVDSFDGWEFCQLQYNYVNETVQAGTPGLKYAAEKGLAVIIMEPLLGGVLAKPPGKMNELFASPEGKNFDPVDLALRWVWNKPEVSLLLSGMTAFDHVVQNLDVANRGIVGSLTEAETAFIDKLRAAYDESQPIKCTKCRYCMPCPSGVDIPLNFETYNNNAAVGGGSDLFRIVYGMMAADIRANCCTRCGACEENCPQKLPIPQLLETVHAGLS